MNEPDVAALANDAMEIARTAWRRAHHGLPSNPMTRTADIVAIATIAASILSLPPGDAEQITERATTAVGIARRASERSGDGAAGNPMARTAEKAAVGILAAGVLRRLS